MKNLILIVEDQFAVADYIRELLRRAKFPTPLIAGSYDEALVICREKAPTLILMDIDLKSEVDGIEAAKRLRSRFDFALVFLSAHADEGFLKRAETLNPHGYLVKPVNNNTVLATVQTVLRRYADERSGLSSSGEDKITIQEDLYYYPHRSMLISGEKQTLLSDLESRLLDILCKNRARIVPIQTIEEHVWPMEYTSECTLTSLVYRLRKKLPAKDIIRTVVGTGYCLD